MRTAPMLTASATVSLTGPLARQGRQAARGLELWASTDQIQLQIVGEPPDYVAAQAAAAGYLAAEAHRRRYQHHQIRRWKTTTMLGNFALDQSWRQIGHTPITIEWRGGRQERAT